MPRCTRKGCSKEYDSAANTEESCTYHPGGPVFHEGLKSWSCCSDVNKPVLDFDEFMKMPGCALGAHTDEIPKVETQKPHSNDTLTVMDYGAGKEQYTLVSPTVGKMEPAAVIAAPKEPAPVVEEEDDLSVPVQTGCGVAFVSDEVNRIGNGEEATCTYHPASSMTHSLFSGKEASEMVKGYLCCKRRVLEFEEFLKIEGCKRGRHVFVPKVSNKAAEEFTECRVDHYQTPSEVHVSVFAKQVDKERSTVRIEENKRTIDLFGQVDPEASLHKYYGTKFRSRKQTTEVGRFWRKQTRIWET
ncbi:hypothetical protein SERLADRAFT_410180 [Serpula lacrymans var. lacrymans S7.9]|uniref:CHORD domain-containing protein n=1 Tax=Serpula lacrymans var. lacrymans (strain S7.9) TaxID=578457 RepID=F8P4N9_SERL9|nr:uncharacterized protein SERLADRAFT_410180 [Serpula lacrymans var. lacrymans S7.9]EGO21576.1 hypothetical protein SERLADRAFT_410180 [Serpula lacrymans var. lacrymans S7.9]